MDVTLLLQLADHLKLSVDDKSTAQVRKSLTALRNGIASLEQQQRQSDALSGGVGEGDAPRRRLDDDIRRLQRDYAELEQRLEQQTEQQQKQDAPYSDDPARAALFETTNPTTPYRDDDDGGDGDDTQPPQSNIQIHARHGEMLREQDRHLDTLGASVSRQRELGEQMGRELDDHVELLGDLERNVDDHARDLDGARRRLRGVAEKARDNWSWLTIAILLLVLVIVLSI